MSDILNGKTWHIHEGDCIAAMHDMPPHCMDFSTYSPPFPSTFAYTNLVEDIGNSEELQHEVKLHFSFFFNAIQRVMKPGRVMVVHCAQIGRLKRAGEEGIFDFRGLLIRLAQRAGFIYEYDWLIRKNPQAQAIRTRKWEIKFQGLEADRSISRGALPDYLIKFRAPGEVAVRIDSKNQVSRNDWIAWAEACWDDIVEQDTLNVAEGRGDDDTKHICPLQLEIYRRLILLYTNPGEIVFEPFAGIGSGGYVALGGKSRKTKRSILDTRRYYGCEIKDEYIAAARVNLERAEAQSKIDESAWLFGDDDLQEETTDVADESQYELQDATDQEELQDAP